MAITEKIIVSGDTRDATQALDRAGSSFDKLGDNVRRAAGAAGLAIGIDALGRAAASAVNLAVRAEEAASAFATSFGPATARMSSFVDEFANKAGFAKFELEGMLAITGSVVQGLGATEEQSAALSREMAVLSGDVASFTDASGGAEAVLAALQSAINGEREALKTYGIAIAETEVQQRALNDSGKARADELTRLEKAEATVALAYEKSAKALGDLDRTQDSSANRLRDLGASAKDAGVEIGQGLLPALEALLPLLEGAADRAGSVGNVIADAFGGFQVIGNSFTNVGAGLAAITAEVLTFGQANTEGLQRTADLAAASNDVANILREVRYGRLSKDATGYANAIADLARKHTLFDDSLESITQGFGLSAEEQYEALRATLQYGEAHGWTAEQIQLLKEFLGELTVAAGRTAPLTEDAFYRMQVAADGFRDAGNDARWVIDTLEDGSQVLRTVGSSFTALGEAVEEKVGSIIEGAGALAQLADDARESADEILRLKGIMEGFQVDIGSIEITGPGRPAPRQHGGPVRGGFPYFVGERGVELFVPEDDGSIVSNRDLRAFDTPQTRRMVDGTGPSIGGGDHNVNVTIDLQVGRNDEHIGKAASAIAAAVSQALVGAGLGGLSARNESGLARAVSDAVAGIMS